MNSEDYRSLDRDNVWHPYTHHQQLMGEEFPVIERGEGVYLYDVEGERYFDAISSWWCTNLGHGHPRLIAALQQQSEKLQHSILGNQSHPGAIKLAAELVELTGGSRRVHFASDGASAVEAALKIAVQYWHNRGYEKKKKIAYLSGDYHGDTLGAVGVGFLPGFHAPYKEIMPRQIALEAPDCSKCFCDKIPANCVAECVASAGETLVKNADRLAAVIVEPLCQAAMGMNIYPPVYLEKLAALCEEHDILLIDDEIAMGFGRTGTMWAYQQAQIRPDIVCAGKALAGGYMPISAAVVDSRIYETFKEEDKTFMHGHTFAGHPLACAVALENIKIYREEQMVDRAKKLGEILEKKMKKLDEFEVVEEVAGLGLLGAVYLKQPGGAELAGRIKEYLLAKKILVRPLGNVVYLMPPFITEENKLSWLVDQLAAAIEKVS
ncbi:MAG: adenosylmethionine--8-amino-7-oxononanoate transaminase [bacterium]